MEADRSRRVEALFAEAAALAPEERAALFERVCAGDAELRREVESLLRADEAAGAFLEQPLVRPAVDDSPAPPSPGLAEGRLIGPYRILRRIGEGGMSEVYLAVRADDAYQKQVSLKVIRHDLNRGDVTRRFRVERQILAGLDHPNIAKMLDGGTTDDGLPYFVMDYIEGVPIDTYCDRQRLPVRERLELFRTVCSAVQYAHQNLIIHRDIKASNILVTADGIPKLLDFGIAKLLKPEGFAEEVEHTQTWLRPMTPRYASPEQFLGKPVTTASDVYSLGVLLYKLLTGHLPYRAPDGPHTDLARLVVDEEPQKPSTSITRVETDPSSQATETTTPESVSRARGTQPQALKRLLAGDLDNILLMALRKDPQRRYASAEQFSEDIRRTLTGLPVTARPDTLGYRTAKFLRRNWLGASVAAAFLILLAGFAISMAVQATRIALERDEARRERDRAERVQAFLQEVFEVSDPFSKTADDLTAREMLDRAAARIERELRDEPLVQAALMQTIGVTYRNLGLFEEARPLLEQALNTRERLLGRDHAAVADSLFQLGELLGLVGEDRAAESRLSRALELRRVWRGEDDPSVVEVMNHLGAVLQHQGRYREAEEVYRSALRAREKAGEDLELATAKNNLASLLFQTGDHAGAETLLREALDLRRRLLGQEHPIVAQNLSSLGAALGVQGRYDEAEPLLREALDMYRALLEPGHPALIEALNNLAKLTHRRGDLDGAERLYGEAIEIERSRFGAAHPKLARLLGNLADVRRDKGDLAGAEKLRRQALAIQRYALGDQHADVAESLIALGKVLVDLGRPKEAEPLLREGLEILRASFGDDPGRTAEARSILGNCLAATGRFGEAEPLLVEGYDQLLASRGAHHPSVQGALRRVVELYERWHRPEPARHYRSLLDG